MSCFGQIKSTFDNFIEIVDTSFNCHNEILCIKNLMDVNMFYQNLSH